MGLMGDPGVILSVQWFRHVTQLRSANAEYSAMDMWHDLEDMLWPAALLSCDPTLWMSSCMRCRGYEA